MKALLISGIYRPEIGGPATYIPALADKLTNDGSKVEVLTLRNSNAKDLSEKWSMNYIIRDQKLPIRFFKTFMKIRTLAKSADVVFANGLFQESATAIMFMKKRSVAKVVGDPVWERARNKGRTKLDIVAFNHSKLNLNQRFQRRFIGWSLNRFDVITCPSAELKTLIQLWGVSRPIEFIPNGVEIAQVSNLDKEFDLVSVCRLVTWKNLDKLIRACASTNSTLAIVGSGPEEANLKSLALSLNANVIFMGQVSEDKVNAVLEKSKIFALLSDYEGLSFSLLQAMAAGLPSIVSTAKGNTDVISNGIEGVVVDVSSEEKISTAIKELKESPENLRKYGQAARIKVERNYLQENQINKVINLFQVESAV